MDTEITPGPGQVWRHAKGDLYAVLYRAKEEATLAEVVVYKSLATGQVWTRAAAEFLPPRFTWVFSTLS